MSLSTELMCSWFRRTRSISGVTGVAVPAPKPSLYNTCEGQQRCHKKPTQHRSNPPNPTVYGIMFSVRITWDSWHTRSQRQRLRKRLWWIILSIGGCREEIKAQGKTNMGRNATATKGCSAAQLSSGNISIIFRQVCS